MDPIFQEVIKVEKEMFLATLLYLEKKDMVLTML